MKLLGELAMVGAIIAVEESLVPGRNDKVGDVHGVEFGLAMSPVSS